MATELLAVELEEVGSDDASLDVNSVCGSLVDVLGKSWKVIVGFGVKVNGGGFDVGMVELTPEGVGLRKPTPSDVSVVDDEDDWRVTGALKLRVELVFVEVCCEDVLVGSALLASASSVEDIDVEDETLDEDFCEELLEEVAELGSISSVDEPLVDIGFDRLAIVVFIAGPAVWFAVAVPVKLTP